MLILFNCNRFYLNSHGCLVAPVNGQCSSEAPTASSCLSISTSTTLLSQVWAISPSFSFHFIVLVLLTYKSMPKSPICHAVAVLLRVTVFPLFSYTILGSFYHFTSSFVTCLSTYPLVSEHIFSFLKMPFMCFEPISIGPTSWFFSLLPHSQPLHLLMPTLMLTNMPKSWSKYIRSPFSSLRIKLLQGNNFLSFMQESLHHHPFIFLQQEHWLNLSESSSLQGHLFWSVAPGSGSAPTRKATGVILPVATWVLLPRGPLAYRCEPVI